MSYASQCLVSCQFDIKVLLLRCRTRVAKGYWFGKVLFERQFDDVHYRVSSYRFAIGAQRFSQYSSSSVWVCFMMISCR